MPYKNIEEQRANRKACYWANPERARQAARKWALENPARAKDSNRLWVSANKTSITERTRKWCEQNKESLRVKKRAYAEANKERIALKYKERSAKNADAIRARSKIWYEKNKEILAKKARARYFADRARRLENKRKNYLANPELYKTHARNRRAMRKGSTGSHTQEDMFAIWGRQGKRCAVKGCVHPIADSGKDRFHVDHIVALVNGGSDNPENLQILCATHNLQKRSRDDLRWANEQGLLFVL